MADVRCPMCGKTNPDDLEVCQFCQARLKPLIIPPDDDADTRELSSSAWRAEPRDSESESEPEKAIPDWLQSLRPGEEGEEFEAFRAEDEEAPSWTPHPDTGSLKSTPADAEANYRDWLTSLRPGQGSEEVFIPEETQPAADWSAPEEKAEATPGWLSDLRSEGEEPPPIDAEAGTTPLAPLDTPDWLRQLRERRKSEEPLPLEEPPSQPEQPDFMDEFSPSQPEETPPSAGEAEPPAQEEEIPDWLSGLVDTPSDDRPEDLPDWLVSGTPPPEESATPALIDEPSDEGFTALPPDAEVKIPDWLSGIMSSKTEPVKSELPLEEEIPAWLSGKDRGAAPKPEIEAEAESAASQADLEWLEAQGTTPPEQPTGGELPKVVAPFTMDEEMAGLEGEVLPEWLKDAGVQEAQMEGAASGDEDAALTPAALPAWLEAMRPVEAAAPGVPRVEESERSVESSGPLAGLRGILRAEPEIARQKKPSAYTIKLQVSESHQAHADIFEKLINAEGVVTPSPVRRQVSRQLLWRAAIFILLALAALWPVYSGSQVAALPQLPTEGLSARNIVNQLPDGSNVLLAVDYEPGFSGEMDAASASLLDHLMIKGSYLAIVSTNPGGPAQAERLLSLVNREGSHQYLSSDQYANLGFIPGGMSGLVKFAGAPQQTLPYALDSSAAWTNTHLAGVNKLSDFALAVVLTESPDTARAWIEQVQPSLGEKPLIMVVSAQAEPLVRPYYDGHPQQVQGMLVGIAGGAAYESSMPRAILARRYWDAYSFALAAAILIMLVAGIVGLLPQFLARRTKGEAEVQL